MEPRLAAPGYRLGNIELIRGIAALMVVAAHSAGALAARGAELGPTESFFAFGVAGVDLFFVISGFVIVWSQLTKARSPLAFMKNRVRRIVPLYWSLTILATIAIVVLAAVGMPLEGTSASPALFASSLFFVSGVAGFDYPMLYQGWTLEYEMLFYLLFAAALVFRRLWLTIAATAAAIIALAIFTPVSNRLLEFVLGMTVAVTTNFLPAPPRWLARTILIAGAVLFLASSQFDLTALPYWLVWGIPSALIVFGAVNLRQTEIRVAGELGAASYAVYLVQWFTVPALALVVGLTGTRAQPVFLLWGVVILVVTQAAGIIITRYFDKPFGRFLRSRGL